MSFLQWFATSPTGTTPITWRMRSGTIKTVLPPQMDLVTSLTQAGPETASSG